jgi:hypothetical protein
MNISQVINRTTGCESTHRNVFFSYTLFFCGINGFRQSSSAVQILVGVVNEIIRYYKIFEWNEIFCFIV